MSRYLVKVKNTNDRRRYVTFYGSNQTMGLNKGEDLTIKIDNEAELKHYLQMNGQYGFEVTYEDILNKSTENGSTTIETPTVDSSNDCEEKESEINMSSSDIDNVTHTEEVENDSVALPETSSDDTVQPSVPDEETPVETPKKRRGRRKKSDTI